MVANAALLDAFASIILSSGSVSTFGFKIALFVLVKNLDLGSLFGSVVSGRVFLAKGAFFHRSHSHSGLLGHYPWPP